MQTPEESHTGSHALNRQAENAHMDDDNREVEPASADLSSCKGEASSAAHRAPNVATGHGARQAPAPIPTTAPHLCRGEGDPAY